MICEKMHPPSFHIDSENTINDPQTQYNIGKTQNSPVHVPTFLQKNDGDPAIKVCSVMLLSQSCILM
jgi:hypothetical protein